VGWVEGIASYHPAISLAFIMPHPTRICSAISAMDRKHRPSVVSPSRKCGSVADPKFTARAPPATSNPCPGGGPDKCHTVHEDPREPSVEVRLKCLSDNPSPLRSGESRIFCPRRIFKAPRKYTLGPDPSYLIDKPTPSEKSRHPKDSSQSTSRINSTSTSWCVSKIATCS
jgi:hypothetical protein